MPGTEHEPAEKFIPSVPLVEYSPTGRTAIGNLTAEDFKNLENLVETAEKHTEDPDAALATLVDLASRRIAMRQARTPKVEDDHDEGRDESSSSINSSGGAMPSHSAPSVKARRPFSGT